MPLEGKELVSLLSVEKSSWKVIEVLKLCTKLKLYEHITDTELKAILSMLQHGSEMVKIAKMLCPMAIATASTHLIEILGLIEHSDEKCAMVKVLAHKYDTIPLSVLSNMYDSDRLVVFKSFSDKMLSCDPQAILDIFEFESSKSKVSKILEKHGKIIEKPKPSETFTLDNLVEMKGVHCGMNTDNPEYQAAIQRAIEKGNLKVKQSFFRNCVASEGTIFRINGVEYRF